MKSNRKIIGFLSPFDKHQNFQVYEFGEVLESKSITVDDIEKTIYELCQKYDTVNVDLRGPKQYSMGIKKKFETNYSNQKFNINVI